MGVAITCGLWDLDSLIRELCAPMQPGAVTALSMYGAAHMVRLEKEQKEGQTQSSCLSGQASLLLLSLAYTSKIPAHSWKHSLQPSELQPAFWVRAGQ